MSPLYKSSKLMCVPCGWGYLGMWLEPPEGYRGQEDMSNDQIGTEPLLDFAFSPLPYPLQPKP
jgi:hypothetical protein